MLTMSAIEPNGDSTSGSDPQSSLKDALTLLITGRHPEHVLQKAEERVKSFEQKGSDEEEENVYYNYRRGAGDADIDAANFHKVEELDVIVGCRNSSSMVDLADTKKFFEEHFTDMPSDPKYWSLDPDNLISSWHRNEQPFSRDCYRCHRIGHIAMYCTRVGGLYLFVVRCIAMLWRAFCCSALLSLILLPPFLPLPNRSHNLATIAPQLTMNITNVRSYPVKSAVNLGTSTRSAQIGTSFARCFAPDATREVMQTV